MNKSIISGLALVIALMSFSQMKSFEYNNSKNVLIFTGENQDTINVFPILDGVVIKFDENSVFIKKSEWQTNLEKSQLTAIDHGKSFRSDLSVTVSTNETLNIPLEGKLVTLHNEYDENLYGIIKKTTQDGETIFKGVPAGFYTLYVSDPENVFETYTLSHFHHGLSSSKELLVQENVASPENINYELVYEGEGLYGVKIKWNSTLYMTGYTYLIYLNEKLIGETKADSYLISSLTPGEYEVTIVGKSVYGNMTLEGSHLLVVVDGLTLGIQSPESETQDAAYFDMQGRIVKNPGPGIYIHKGKKILIK